MFHDVQRHWPLLHNDARYLTLPRHCNVVRPNVAQWQCHGISVGLCGTSMVVSWAIPLSFTNQMSCHDVAMDGHGNTTGTPPYLQGAGFPRLTLHRRNAVCYHVVDIGLRHSTFIALPLAPMPLSYALRRLPGGKMD